MTSEKSQKISQQKKRGGGTDIFENTVELRVKKKTRGRPTRLQGLKNLTEVEIDSVNAVGDILKKRNSEAKKKGW